MRFLDRHCPALPTVCTACLVKSVAGTTTLERKGILCSQLYRYTHLTCIALTANIREVMTVFLPTSPQRKKGQDTADASINAYVYDFFFRNYSTQFSSSLSPVHARCV